MILVTPVLACPAGTNCGKTSANCPNCVNNIGNLSNITKLNSETVDKNVQTILQSNDVKRLIIKLNSEGYKLNQTGAEGLSSTVIDTYYEAVALPFASTDNSDGAIVAILTNNKIVKVQATIVHRDKDQFPTSVKILTVNGNAIETESATIDSGAKAYMASVVSIASTSPLSHLDQATSSLISCSTCKSLYNLACAVGCSLGMYAICGLLGLTTGAGGAACVVAATLLCAGIQQYGCDPYGAQAACVVAGYC